MRPLLPVLLTTAIGVAVAAPSGSVAQDPPPRPPGCSAIATFGTAQGANAGFIGIERCYGPNMDAFAVKATFTVSESTRRTLKLPSTTLAKGTATGNSTGGKRDFATASRSTLTALKKARNGTKMTVKVKFVYTAPVSETVTDSIIVKKDGANFYGNQATGIGNLDTQNAPNTDVG